MSNLGIGIGSFMTGLAQGMALKNKQDQQKIENDLAERKMKLIEGKDARDAQNDAQDRKWKQEDRDFQTSERSADAPIKAAQRKAQLDGLNDESEMRTTLRTGTDNAKKEYEAEKAKSILIGKDEAGNETYTVDGEKAASKDDADKLFEQRHSTFMDAYRTKMVPAVVQGYLKRGDVKSADAFQKWSNQKGVENAVHDYGRMMQSLQLSDWDGANKSLNSMMKNGDYVSQDRHDIKAEPIKDKDGKTAGIRVNYKDKVTGANSSKDFTSMDEFHQFAATMASPDSAFEQGKRDYEAHISAQSDKAKGLNKLANDITLESAKSANKMDEDQLKSRLSIVEEFAKKTNNQSEINQKINIWKSMNEIGQDSPFRKEIVENGKTKKVDMTPAEQAALVEEQYKLFKDNDTTASPAAPVPGAGGATPPAARSIMRQDAPAQQPTLAPPPRRQLPFFSN